MCHFLPFGVPQIVNKCKINVCIPLCLILLYWLFALNDGFFKEKKTAKKYSFNDHNSIRIGRVETSSRAWCELIALTVFMEWIICTKIIQTIARILMTHTQNFEQIKSMFAV